MKIVKAGIIGQGNIGSELLERLPWENRVNWGIGFIANTKKIFTSVDGGSIVQGNIKHSQILKNIPSALAEQCATVNIVFLAVSSRDDGKEEYELLKMITSLGKPVVTCAKGALSNFFSELSSSSALPLIGYNAAVGGGTMILKEAKSRLDSFVHGLIVILNGTMNHFMDRVSEGKSYEEAIAEARRNKYVEPPKDGGKSLPEDILTGEACRDAPMKTAVFCNHVLGIPLWAREIEVPEISFDGVRFLVNNAANFRHFVTFERLENRSLGYGEDPIIGAFNKEVDGWRIKGGFRRLNPMLRAHLLVPDVTNVLIADEGSYGYNIIARGLGAGPGPTVTTMIRDGYRLLNM